MNFERLCKYIILQHSKIKPRDLHLIKNFLRNLYSIVLLNKQKLKLGKVIFLINDFNLNHPFRESVVIKFVNQNIPSSPQQHFQQLYDEFTWKWTKSHLLALFVVITALSFILWKNFANWTILNLPFLYYQSTAFQHILHMSLSMLFSVAIGTHYDFSTNLSAYVDFIYHLCMYFNIII